MSPEQETVLKQWSTDVPLHYIGDELRDVRAALEREGMIEYSHRGYGWYKLTREGKRARERMIRNGKEVEADTL